MDPAKATAVRTAYANVSASRMVLQAARAAERAARLDPARNGPVPAELVAVEAAYTAHEDAVLAVVALCTTLTLPSGWGAL